MRLIPPDRPGAIHRGSDAQVITEEGDRLLIACGKG